MTFYIDGKSTTLYGYFQSMYFTFLNSLPMRLTSSRLNHNLLQLSNAALHQQTHTGIHTYAVTVTQ